MPKQYKFINLSEAEVKSILCFVSIQKQYSRGIAEVIDLYTTGTFIDGTPKYIVKINSSDEILMNRFENKKRKI